MQATSSTEKYAVAMGFNTKVKERFALEQAIKVQMGSIGIDPLFL